MNKIISLVCIATLIGCSSAPERTEYISQAQQIEPQPDKVLSRIDNLGERPSWVKESEPFYVEKGAVYSLGMTTLQESQRVEAGYRIASSNAKHVMAQSIEQRLSYVLQRSEENEGFDSTQTRYIGAEVTELTTSHIKPSKYYWEKVVQFDSQGDRQIIYKVFALVSIPEGQFRKAIIDVAKKGQKSGQLTQDFNEKVNAHWQDFVRGPASQQVQ